MDSMITSAAMDVALFCRLNRYRHRCFPVCHSELGILIFISAADQPVSPMTVSSFLEISKPRTTAAIKSLCEKGYIERIPSKQDGRSFTLSLTPKGRSVTETAYEEFSGLITELREEMGREDFSTLMDLIHRANVILKK